VTTRFLTRRLVVLVHDAQVRVHGGTYGVLDDKRLDAILGRAEQYMYYAAGDLFDLAALYLEGIAHDHPFRDANKRTGWVASVAFLRLNGADLEISDEKVLALTLGAAKGSLKAAALAEHLRAHAKKP
jgi:death on curing protein